MDLRSGLPASAETIVPFTARARAILAITEDTKVLLSALATMRSAAASLMAARHTSNAYPMLCSRLLKRAKLLYPETSVSCEAPALDTEISVDEKAKVTKRVSPKYRE